MMTYNTRLEWQISTKGERTEKASLGGVHAECSLNVGKDEPEILWYVGLAPVNSD